MKYLTKINILNNIKNNFKYINYSNIFKKPLIIYKGKNGIMSCKYIDLTVAEEQNEVLCRFTKINNIEDMYDAKLVDCTTLAKKMGITEDMTGKEVFQIINR